MPKYSILPVYDVEYIPAERRLSDRCVPQQRLKEILPSGERRTSPGRRKDDQVSLFCSFNLEDHVPANHLLRGIDRFLDLRDLRQYLADHHSHTGLPSIDPELMIRMLVIGYCFGIRSERRLCEEVHLNLAFRWFCRLGQGHSVPDHSLFSKNRHARFREGGVFHHLFENELQRCMAEGMARGEGFATDASIIKADAQRQRGMSSDEVMDWGNPHEAAQSVRKYLAGLEEANGSSIPHQSMSLPDPSANWIASPGGPDFLAYSTKCLIDLKAGIIVDTEASALNKAKEVSETQAMIERAEDKFDIKLARQVGDNYYGSAAMLGWLVDEKQIAPAVPGFEKSECIDDTLGCSSFTFDAENNRYTCQFREQSLNLAMQENS